MHIILLSVEKPLSQQLVLLFKVENSGCVSMPVTPHNISAADLCQVCISGGYGFKESHILK
jgi:hypothetical protein